jgi:hypothetical protein
MWSVPELPPGDLKGMKSPWLIEFFEVRLMSFHNLAGFEQEAPSQYSRHDEQEQRYICHRDVGENYDCL